MHGLGSINEWELGGEGVPHDFARILRLLELVRWYLVDEIIDEDLGGLRIFNPLQQHPHDTETVRDHT